MRSRDTSKQGTEVSSTRQRFLEMNTTTTTMGYRVTGHAHIERGCLGVHSGSDSLLNKIITKLGLEPSSLTPISVLFIPVISIHEC